MSFLRGIATLVMDTGSAPSSIASLLNVTGADYVLFSPDKVKEATDAFQAYTELTSRTIAHGTWINAPQPSKVSTSHPSRDLPVLLTTEYPVSSIVHSSGSTGAPKAIHLTHKSWIQNVCSVPACPNLQEIKNPPKSVATQASLLLVTPMYHHYTRTGVLSSLAICQKCFILPYRRLCQT
jgi:acyl-CoA synthetase (AMP-forming)/AMP-acid ligase II